MLYVSEEDKQELVVRSHNQEAFFPFPCPPDMAWVAGGGVHFSE